MAKQSRRRSVSKKQRKSAKKSGKTTHKVSAHLRRTPSGKRVKVRAHRSH